MFILYSILEYINIKYENYLSLKLAQDPSLDLDLTFSDNIIFKNEKWVEIYLNTAFYSSVRNIWPKE